jgi:hypothetical protein
MAGKRCTELALPVRRSDARWGEVTGSGSRACTGLSVRRSAALACWLLVAGVAVAGCGDQPTRASCANILTWRGEHYLGVAASTADFPPAGEALSPAAALASVCGKERGRPTRVTVLSMGSGDPAVQLWVRGQRRAAFLHLGYFIALPTHPLHRAFFGSNSKPYIDGDGRRCRFSGYITNVTPRDITVTTDRAGSPRVLVTIDARPETRGLRRQGLPYLHTGDAISVAGRRCSIKPGPGFQGATAASITPH